MIIYQLINNLLKYLKIINNSKKSNNCYFRVIKIKLIFYINNSLYIYSIYYFNYIFYI